MKSLEKPFQILRNLNRKEEKSLYIIGIISLLCGVLFLHLGLARFFQK